VPTSTIPHFLQAGCSSCRPTNSVKALTSAFGLGRRRYSSPQRCYLHHLRTYYIAREHKRCRIKIKEKETGRYTDGGETVQERMITMEHM